MEKGDIVSHAWNDGKGKERVLYGIILATSEDDEELKKFGGENNRVYTTMGTHTIESKDLKVIKPDKIKASYYHSEKEAEEFKGLAKLIEELRQR